MSMQGGHAGLTTTQHSYLDQISVHCVSAYTGRGKGGGSCLSIGTKHLWLPLQGLMLVL